MLLINCTATQEVPLIDCPCCFQAFNIVFHKAVEMAEACEDVESRVNTLIDRVTYSTFNYISRGLFERDKLTFTAQLAFQVCVTH